MIYVDTSVIVALLTTEPKTQAVTAWFAELRDVPICADWLLTEFHSTLDKAVDNARQALISGAKR